VFIVTVLLSLVLAAAFVISGSFKIVKNPTGADSAYDLGYPLGVYKVIGWLEVLGAIGLLAGLYSPRVGEIAAIGLAVLMVVMLLSNLRVKANLAKLATPLALGGLAVLTYFLRVQTA
jgi:uncharacterized membrane protein YphA (DoxX/SURF4 family)